MIKDKNIAWRRKRVFVKLSDMLGLAANRTASLGAGAAVFQEADAAVQLAGLAAAAGGDEIFDLWPFPSDMDPTHPLRFRYWFSHSTTDADAPIFKTFYKAIGKQIALSAANSSPDETITHDAHTVSTDADALEITDWAESISDTLIAPTDFALLLACEIDNLGGAGANEITIFGLEIEYTLKATDDTNKRRITNDAPAAPNQFAD
jgi:hypothetical protein